MTQHFIRKRAGMGWIKRSYHRLREPRAVSAIYGLAYIAATVFGGTSIFIPPRTIDAVAGVQLMTVITVLITLGGTVGIVTVAIGAYWLERFATAAILLGLAGYLFMVTYLAFTGTGNRYLSILSILLSCGFAGLRYFWTLTSPYNPEKVNVA